MSIHANVDVHCKWHLHLMNYENPSITKQTCLTEMNVNSNTLLTNWIEVGSQFPQFFIQIGLEGIIGEEIRESFTKRKPEFVFAIEKDTHLISSWLNISTDPIVGVGQTKEAFWLRVTKNYNKFWGELRESSESTKILMTKN